MQDYLSPLAKVRDVEGHLGNLVAQKIQSKATLGGRSGLRLMVLAPTERQDISRTVAANPLHAPCEVANRAVPASPAPVP